jgi:hypothetical protein
MVRWDGCSVSPQRTRGNVLHLFAASHSISRATATMNWRGRRLPPTSREMRARSSRQADSPHRWTVNPRGRFSRLLAAAHLSPGLLLSFSSRKHLIGPTRGSGTCCACALPLNHKRPSLGETRKARAVSAQAGGPPGQNIAVRVAFGAACAARQTPPRPATHPAGNPRTCTEGVIFSSM